MQVSLVKKLGILGPNHEMVSSQELYDKKDPTKLKEDCAVYHTLDAPTDSRPDWFTKRLSIEFKAAETSDPFDDNPAANFEPMTNDRHHTRGQIIDYASKIFLHQHRCFYFSLVVFGVHARMIRWERAGAVVSRSFNYMTDTAVLLNFLRRFGRMSRRQQGYDISATVLKPNSPEYELMTEMAKLKEKNPGDYVAGYFAKSLANNWPRYQVEVPDITSRFESDEDSDDEAAPTEPPKTRKFLICEPHFDVPGLVGRGTRGYVAIDVKEEQFVFLKDAWRVAHCDIEPEGNTLALLNKEGVEYVPTLVCHGDILGQKTLTGTHKHFSSNAPGSDHFKFHRHYRMVCKEVGQKLEDFRDGEELVAVIADCIWGETDCHMISSLF